MQKKKKKKKKNISDKSPNSFHVIYRETVCHIVQFRVMNPHPVTVLQIGNESQTLLYSDFINIFFLFRKLSLLQSYTVLVNPYILFVAFAPH